MRKYFAFFLSSLFILLISGPATAQEIISLRWDDVVGISRLRNLDLQIARQDYRNQKLNQWKVYSDFLPTITIKAKWNKNILSLLGSNILYLKNAVIMFITRKRCKTRQRNFMN